MAKKKITPTVPEYCNQTFQDAKGFFETLPNGQAYLATLQRALVQISRDYSLALQKQQQHP